MTATERFPFPLMAEFKVSFQGDSLCAEKNCRNNILENNIDTDNIDFLNPDEIPEDEISRILIKIPKSLNYLEYQLQYISSSLPPGIQVIAAEMSRNIHSSTVSLFEHYLKDIRTSLAWKKARLVTGKTGGSVTEKNSYPVSIKPAYEDFELINYPGLFSFGRVDPGAAFMMSNFPRVKNSSVVIDLACGDGIFALKAALLWKESAVICTDESYLALKSAKESFEKNGLKGRAEFLRKDSLEGISESSADVILCNPPFHSSHSLSTSTAVKMFRESFKTLKKGGELFVVANIHLGYEKQLLRLFKKVNIVRTNKKFSIIRAVK